ncbi:hypothetical protein WR25_20736 [Diploscapter pachys]|uniref:Uncharacterized protein n=1 Tax=Diploscapter pachys TaxID=2018661 RepID=A0A2A2KTA2_9BILA|nr:hypothetical protein WR25_20736 [Diploscapter pachys]
MIISLMIVLMAITERSDESFKHLFNPINNFNIRFRSFNVHFQYDNSPIEYDNSLIEYDNSLIEYINK